jgi:hypothetical protein
VQLLRKRPRTEDEQPPLFKFQRCFHCEPYKEHKGPCRAQAAFAALESDLDEQVAKVEEGEELGKPDPAARRAARYFLYRLYVFNTHGALGRGNRVRVPLCVVERIRHRLREPGCVCALGGPLAACQQYVGHREV